MTNVETENIATINTLQLVSFKTGDEEYGIDIQCVQEINRFLEVTKIPNSTYFVEGIINLREHILPIIDLRTLLGIKKKEADKETRIIIIELNGKKAGFIVDAVNEVLRVSNSIVDTPPELIRNMNNDFITSVIKLDDRLISILDLEKIIDGDKLSSLLN